MEALAHKVTAQAPSSVGLDIARHADLGRDLHGFEKQRVI